MHESKKKKAKTRVQYSGFMLVVFGGASNSKERRWPRGKKAYPYDRVLWQILLEVSKDSLTLFKNYKLKLCLWSLVGLWDNFEKVRNDFVVICDWW